MAKIKKIDKNTSMFAKRQKLKPEDIDELKIILLIVSSEKSNFACDVIKMHGGVVLSKQKAKGLSRYSLFTSIGAFTKDCTVVLAGARKEDVEYIMTNLTVALNLEKPGVGKAMVVDVLGYMGAKAAF